MGMALMEWMCILPLVAFFPSSSLVRGEMAMGFKMCNYYRRGEDGELERMRRGSVVYRLMSDFKGERNE